MPEENNNVGENSTVSQSIHVEIAGKVSGLTTRGLLLESGPDIIEIAPGATNVQWRMVRERNASYAISISRQPWSRDEVCTISGNTGVIGHSETVFSIVCRPTEWSVTTMAGSGLFAFADGSGASTSFNEPRGIAVDGSGSVYIADTQNFRVRKMTPDGTVSTLAGSGSRGFSDGTGSEASFWRLNGIAVAVSGDVYVSDFTRIRKITPAGVVTTVAGKITAGAIDGDSTAATFGGYIDGLVFGPEGELYIADRDNHKIRKLARSGEVTTVAGTGERGYRDGTAASAQFDHPGGIAVDRSGNLYVSDARIRKIDPQGNVSTIAGYGVSTPSGETGTGQIGSPYGLAVDGRGNVFVGLQGETAIWKIAADGNVRALFDHAYWAQHGSFTSDVPFQSPYGVAVDATGNVYVADTGNNRIRKITAR